MAMLYSKRRKNLGGGRRKRSNRKSYGAHMLGGSVPTIESQQEEIKRLKERINFLDNEIVLWKRVNDDCQSRLSTRR